MKSKEIQERAKRTCLEKYGVNHPMKSEEVILKIAWSEISKKAFETKIKNGTCNTSKIEDDAYKWLFSLYPDIKRNWPKDPRYPFHIDFYIPSEDLFIEVQGNWTHGKHPFDNASEEDRALLEEWRRRAKTSKYYANAIEVWTGRDVKKREAAEANRLKYFEYFGNTFEEFKEQFILFIKQTSAF